MTDELSFGSCLFVAFCFVLYFSCRGVMGNLQAIQLSNVPWQLILLQPTAILFAT